jgi:hypothetical protein
MYTLKGYAGKSTTQDAVSSMLFFTKTVLKNNELVTGIFV